MIGNIGLLLSSLAYFGLLFSIAYYADVRRKQGRSLINNATIYSLSLAVYCTGWTYFGSVGLAANEGFSFLPIYLGPTLSALLWALVLRKIIRICKLYSLSSLADFISSRYGKSPWLGGFVASIAVIGVVPYIALQLKAISSSFQLVVDFPEELITFSQSFLPFTEISTFYIMIALIVFAIAFGVRSLDATERHEGLVAAIAFESLVKLVAFLAVGLFVVFVMYNGFGDLFEKARAVPELQELWNFKSNDNAYTEWFFLSILAMLAILFLPRQFQMAVVENVNEAHLNRAIWLFPLYLFLINIFVFPIALAGRLQFPSSFDADTFVLALPFTFGHETLVWMVFIGGLSAATGMIIVETVALGIMISNSLVMPILIRLPLVQIREGVGLNRMLLTVRRGSVVLVLFVSYLYYQAVGSSVPLVSTGLISFLAVAQFAPSMLGGLYWKNGTRLGALTGLSVGFLIWAYTLPFTHLIQAGWFPAAILSEGIWGTSLLKPTQLFGLDAMSPIAQATFWSLFLNTACFLGVSLLTRQSAEERNQANLFVDVWRYSLGEGYSKFWRGTASTHELRLLLKHFLGEERTYDALQKYARQHNLNLKEEWKADGALVQYTEKLLSGAIGSVAAQIMVSSVVEEEPLKIEEVMDILDETQQAISYSQQLEEKSKQLLETSEELRRVNLRLTELDTLKDDFISRITHELRTPLTSIRAFSEILHDTPELDLEQRTKFLNIVIKESERLTRLINRILDFEKLESQKMVWNMEEITIQAVIAEAVDAMSQLTKDKNILLQCDLTESLLKIYGDYDRLIQVMINLLSNAVKFCPEQGGQIWVTLQQLEQNIEVRIKDNGVGILPEDQKHIFEKFWQVHNSHQGKSSGSGLGLSISKDIIEHHQGHIGVAPGSETGAIFYFTLPLNSQ